MRYGIKVPKKSERYYENKDLDTIRKKYKGKLPPYSVISREAQQHAFNEHKALRTKGTIVSYKGKTAVVIKANNKGVFLQPLDKDYLDSPNEKPIFVKNEDYVPNVMFHPFNRIRMYQTTIF